MDPFSGTGSQCVKTLDAFAFGLNRDAVLQVFGRSFVTDAANAVFVGGVGTGKTRLSHLDRPREEGGPAAAEVTE